MQPPESQGGKVAASLGIVAAGAAAGATAGALYLPTGNVGRVSARAIGAVAGAIAGAGLTGVIALGLSEFVGGDWEEIERMTALIGAGGVGLLVTAGLANELVTVKAAMAQGQVPQQLPAGSQNFTAGESDSGRTLNMHVGDTLSINLPAGTGGSIEQWQWSATQGLVTLTSDTVAPDPNNAQNVVETAVFTAAAVGSGQVQGTVGGATFVLNVNVTAG